METDREEQDKTQSGSSTGDSVNESLSPQAVKPSVIKIGGSAPTQITEQEEDDPNQAFIPRQTTVVGLSELGDDKDNQGQVQVIAPEYSQERKKIKPQSFTTASQTQIDMENQSNLKIILPIILVVSILLAGVAYYMFISHTS